MSENANKALYELLEPGIPYLVIMRNGHEYHVFIEDKLPSGWMIGKVVVKMIVTLYDPGENSAGLVVSLDYDTVEAKKLFEGKEVYIQEPCSVKHKHQTVRIWSGDVSILEDSWRLPVRIGANGKADEDYLVERFPEFGKYRLPSGGFCTNPAAGGPIIIPATMPDLKMIRGGAGKPV